MENRVKRAGLVVAKFAIPVAIIVFLFANIPAEKWEKLTQQDKNYPLLAAALLVALTAISLSFSRWCLLVRCLRIDLSLVESFRLGAIGLLLSFVSVGSVGGDLFKAIFLARRRPGKRVAAIASILVDRGCGLFGLVLLVAITLIVAPPHTSGVQPNGSHPTDLQSQNIESIRFWTAIMVVAGTTTLAFLVLGGRRVDQWLGRLSEIAVIGRPIATIGPPLRMFHEHPVGLFVSIAMSFLVHTGFTLSVYLIARGLYDNPPTLSEHYIIVPIGLLASAIPITPAGLGVFEGAVHWLYEVIPAQPTLASGVIVALGFQLVRVTVAIIGVVFYWTAGEEVRQVIEVAEQE